jgi:DNA-binding response OmpR family regulator
MKEPQSGTESRKRILIVDDERDAVEVLKILLALEGYEVRTAFSEKTALETAGAFRPEAILLYTGIFGSEIGEVVKNLRWAIPQILLVGLIHWKEKKETPLYWQEAGFDAYLMKPVKIEEVLALLRGSFNS